MKFALTHGVVAGGFCIAAGLCAPPARAAVIDFNDRPAGTVIDDEYAAQGVTITGDNINSHFDIATLLDPNGPKVDPDPDQRIPFDLGNLAPAGPGGNILIIQDAGAPTITGGLVASPNDENARPAGSLFFDFSTPITEFGWDLTDVDGPAEYNRNAGFFATFFGGGAEIRVGFGLFVTPGTAFYDPTVMYGDESANRIRPITARELGLDQIERVEINLGGSGGVDNINFQPIPEPGTLGLALAALPLLTLRRRRSA